MLKKPSVFTLLQELHRLSHCVNWAFDEIKDVLRHINFILYGYLRLWNIKGNLTRLIFTTRSSITWMFAIPEDRFIRPGIMSVACKFQNISPQCSFIVLLTVRNKRQPDETSGMIIWCPSNLETDSFFINTFDCEITDKSK